MFIKSEKYPNIMYEPGQEIWLNNFKGEEFPYCFDVELGLTEDKKNMELVGKALDQLESFEQKAMQTILKISNDKDDPEFSTVDFFLKFHLDEFDPETLGVITGSDSPETLTTVKLAEFLRPVRFGSGIDAKTGKQFFIMDLSLNPDYSDELIVVYFNLDGDIENISHES